ncbi:hypothetical protein niasHS_014313 [Heterodera schachtii]|uniref:Uncharacterized protein n=1 Tax=Heterodera schachtii TaxID=97005 RepID=A0ABD2INK0_HETSC
MIAFASPAAVVVVVLLVIVRCYATGPEASMETVDNAPQPQKNSFETLQEQIDSLTKELAESKKELLKKVREIKELNELLAQTKEYFEMELGNIKAKAKLDNPKKDGQMDDDTPSN